MYVKQLFYGASAGLRRSVWESDLETESHGVSIAVADDNPSTNPKKDLSMLFVDSNTGYLPGQLELPGGGTWPQVIEATSWIVAYLQERHPRIRSINPPSHAKILEHRNAELKEETGLLASQVEWIGHVGISSQITEHHVDHTVLFLGHMNGLGVLPPTNELSDGQIRRAYWQRINRTDTSNAHYAAIAGIELVTDLQFGDTTRLDVVYPDIA